MQSPPALQEATKPNLAKPIKELMADGDSLNITDPSLPDVPVNIKIKFK
jgi:ubiquitin-activating enzyme E1 C